jgi:hypothetical protein
MERLRGQVERELVRVGPGGAEMAAIVRIWPAAVGEATARHAWPARLARDGTLHVNATDSIWASQLGTLAEAILERLREHAGPAAPAALRFAPGPIPEPAAEPTESRAPSPLAIAAEDAARGAELAAEIDDPELRETLARAAAASLARTRSDRDF